MVFNFKTYDELIQHARSEYRQKGMGTYYELHHIIPRNNGGTDDNTNLVLLTVAEHVEAHYLYAMEHINNQQLYYANLSACIIIIYPKNSYNKKDKKQAIEKFLQDPTFQKLIEEAKIKQAQYVREHPTNTGKTFYFEHKWFQYKSQKPVSIALKSVEKYKERGFIEIADCPICHKKNSRENFCCCEEHKQQYLDILDKNYKAEKSAQSKTMWANSEHRQNVSQLISTAYKKRAELQDQGLLDKKHWIHNDTDALQVNESDIQNYLDKGYKIGRTDKVEKPVYTEEEKRLRRSAAQLAVSEKKRETWQKRGWSEEDHIKRSKAIKAGFANSEWYSKPKCWVQKNGESKRILKKELSSYLSDGWIQGRGKLKIK